MGSRFSLLMLLGIVFLASLSESLTEKPSRRKCVKICESEKDPSRGQTCQLRCKHVSEPGGKEEEEREIPEPHQEGEKKKKEVEKEEREKPRPFPPPHPTEHEREEEQWRGRHRRGDPEERERVRQREREEEEIREREREKKKGEKHWRREKKEKWEEIEEDRGFPNSDSQKQNNPFHFSSNRFRTLFKNQHGHIRVLQRFDQRSSRQLQNLQERNFLAGEKENVISEIPRQVLEVAFPGNVEKLIKKQRESYFVDAQPQQQKEDTGRNGKKVPLSSILDPLY